MTSNPFDALAVWWAGVDPVFAFLLLLPVLVAACGLAADLRRRPPR